MCALTRSHVCHEQDLLKSWVDTNRARIKGIEIPRKEDVIGDEIIFPREKEEEWLRDTTAKSAVIIFNDSSIPSGHEEKPLVAENTRALAELDANVQKLRETYKKKPIHMFRMHFTAENKKNEWNATHAEMEKVWNGIYAQDKASALQHTPTHTGVPPTPVRRA